MKKSPRQWQDYRGLHHLGRDQFGQDAVSQVINPPLLVRFSLERHSHLIRRRAVQNRNGPIHQTPRPMASGLCF